MIIRQGSIEEVISIIHACPEFDRPYPESEYKKRFVKTPHLILLAEVDGNLAGTKVGYERDNDGSFYSWMGGVLPAYRRLGIARKLAEAQEEWAMENGYTHVRFKTRNRHRNMLHFALSRDFYLIRVDHETDVWEHRIWMEKRLAEDGRRQTIDDR